jgi:cytosine/creatinine deaminase
MTLLDDAGALALALEEARTGMAAGNDPVGAVLLRDGIVLGRGHNRFLAGGDPTSHAEMEAYRDAARRLAGTTPVHTIEDAIAGADMVTTAMPCPMCAGAILRWRARRVLVSEDQTYSPGGTRAWMERHGIAVEVRRDEAVIALVRAWLADHPERRPAYGLPGR